MSPPWTPCRALRTASIVSTGGELLEASGTAAARSGRPVVESATPGLWLDGIAPAPLPTVRRVVRALLTTAALELGVTSFAAPLHLQLQGIVTGRHATSKASPGVSIVLGGCSNWLWGTGSWALPEGLRWSAEGSVLSEPCTCAIDNRGVLVCWKPL